MYFNKSVIFFGLIGIAIGFSVGCSIGYFYNKKQLKTLNDSMDEQMKKLQETIYAKKEELRKINNAAKEEAKNAVKRYSGEFNQEEETNDDEVDEEDEGRILTEEAAKRTPELIDDASFYNTCMYYDKITWTYYAQDDILANEDEVIVDDPERYLGNLLDVSGFLRDPAVTEIFVRNASLSTDYLITKMDASYADLY